MRLIFLAILFPLFLSSQNNLKYPGLLWKITGNGTKEPSYLYGTMHVSNRVAWYLSEEFFDALKKVDVVGLETNPGEWLENMEKTGELAEAAKMRSGSSYPSNFYKSAFANRFPEKRMLQAIISYDPDIINGLLYRQNRNKENFEENTYIDLFIYQTAAKLNKQIISLEDFTKAEIMARLSAIPDEETEENRKSYRNSYTSSQQIEDAYRQGNLDMLDSLSKLVSSRNTQKYLIDERNVFFVQTIDSVLKTKTLFSGVGAAHLPGPDGVIELLRQKGYTVEPVSPTVSKKSASLRDKIDELVKPLTFNKQFISDSTFSVDLPGRLFPIVDVGNLRYDIHADMANGAFYTVVRLKHMAPLFNITAAELLQRVDSLLFENIPGKILLKKNIVSNTGLKGFEIVNRTRKGDEQRYQFYFSDVEMIVFKLGGKHQYATSKAGNQFFNSIKFYAKPDTDVLFSPPNKGFSMLVPANYSYIKHNSSALFGMTEELFAYSASSKHFIGVQRAVYNDFNYLEEDTFELAQFTKAILDNYKYNETKQFSFVPEQGFPSVRFHAANDQGGYIDGKIIIKGVHYYFVYQISQKDSPKNFKCFDSFKLTDFEYLNPIKEIKDEEFLFKVKDEVTENAFSRFNDSFTKVYEATLKKVDTLKKDTDYRSGNKVYYSPSSNEFVNITFEKYNDYDYRNMVELEKRIESVFIQNSSMYMVGKKSKMEKDQLNYSFSLKDTATAKAIRVQLYFKNSTMHEISAPYDTTIGLQGWTKIFMESFQPIDSAAGKNIFENKFSDLLNDIAGTDTAKKAAANIAIGSISMDKEFADPFVAFVESTKFQNVNQDSRAQLLVNGGTMKSNKIIAPYRNLYKQYTDSFYLQLSILRGLALLKTKESYAAFLDLIVNEPPLVGNENTVFQLLSDLNDSLELCVQFYPKLLNLTRFEEYRHPVYGLLANLIQKKMLLPNNYQTHKDNIVADANLALKRYTPGSRHDDRNDYAAMDATEKLQRELQELIKNNLEGLEKNMNRKNTFAFPDYSEQPTIVCYAVILAPFYKTDKKAANFIDKVLKIKSQEIAMPVTILLLKQNLILNDTILSFYSKNKYTRTYFYSELEKESLIKYFDTTFLNQKSLVESVLQSENDLKSRYKTNKAADSDTLHLVAIRAATNKYQNGKIYVYKNASKTVGEEQWQAAFVAQTDGSPTANVELLTSSFYPDLRKSEAENINKILEQFSLKYRKRAQPKTNYYQ